ncbi:DNA cytosine methyltransferase [Lonepinella sp. BR2474]|uniref:DNA cytosine methyltransferase n=1 Tax=Lonepinella sp. BR2474 TaxID=3434548 RepID=UPI003F6E27FA
MDNKPFDVISLFSGAGGLDLGFKGGFAYLGKQYAQHPFNVVWANDLNERACKTFQHNFPNIPVVCGDINQIDKNTLPSADIVLGGFPCQDFSVAGKRQGLAVERGQLYLNMVEVVKKVQPKLFLAENVKGLLTWQKGLAITTIVDDFRQLGYDIDYRLLNTANYGVPQTRERVIIVGIRKDLKIKFNWPQETHSEQSDGTKKPWVSLKQAIGDLESDEVHFSLPNSGYSKAKLFKGTQGNTKTKADKPGPTMRAEHHGNIEFHYTLDRRLSAREAARIQSFPDDFVFLNSTTDAYRQVGNAVAPVFAWHLAQAVKESLR